MQSDLPVCLQRRRQSALLLAFAALASVCGLLLSGCGVVARGLDNALVKSERTGTIGRSGALTPQEVKWARIAWRYFENNTQLETGLVNGLDRQPVFTIWQLGDYLSALIAAHEIGLIDKRDFDLRLSSLLRFLASMDLSEGKLPNKAYNAITGKMVDFGNQPRDIGWSAVDIGRLLTWMKIAQQRYPLMQEYFDKAALRWNYCDVIDPSGALYGTSRQDGKTYRYQEGRLGYEQLGRAGFDAWGLSGARPFELPPTERVNIQGLKVPYDARDPRTSGAQAPVLTMPYVYLGLEQGWKLREKTGDKSARTKLTLEQIADTVFHVQHNRYLQDGVFTARSDYQLATAPYHVLDSIYAAGYAWNTVDSEGREYEELALVNTRAAFGMWAIWPSGYTDKLADLMQSFHDPQRGWYEGRFENSGAAQTTISLSTNAAILEALLFKVKGELYGARGDNSRFAQRQQDKYLGNRCSAVP